MAGEDRRPAALEPASTERLARLAGFVRAEAARLGFSACGVADPAAGAAAGEGLRAFVEAGRHGSMTWMAETLERRADPKVLWADVRSIVCLAMDYGPDEDPRRALEDASAGAISVYARGRDYHDVVKGRLKELAGRMVRRAGELGLAGEVKVFVDTAPVMEKPIAQGAGLGWQGRHTNLVSRRLGSWFFLGEIFTTFDLPVDRAETDHCGSCRACLEACPTDAFPASGQLDARRCVSYLTIEHAGPIPRDLRPRLGNRIYGCDDCLAACPWNKFAAIGREAKLAARDDLRRPALAELAGLDDVAFRARFSGSPIKRIGRDRFLRNVLVAIGNSGDPGLVQAVRAHLGDPAPLVRGAAVWALARLLPAQEFAALAGAAGGEADPDVAEEWRLALAGSVPG